MNSPRYVDNELNNIVQQIYNAANQISDKHLKIRIVQWLDKVQTPTQNAIWRQNSLLYARVLLEMARSHNLEKPFKMVPPDGPLPFLNRFDVPQYIWKRLTAVKVDRQPLKLINRQYTPKLRTEPNQSIEMSANLQSKSKYNSKQKEQKEQIDLKQWSSIKVSLEGANKNMQEFKLYLDKLSDNTYELTYDQDSIEIQVQVHQITRGLFIAAASEIPIDNVVYEEGQEFITDLMYDHEAFTTQQDTHFIRITKHYPILYLYIGYANDHLNSDLSNYNNHTISINNYTGCVSKCFEQGYTCNTEFMCVCPNNKFGEYCQLDRSNAILDIQYDSIIKPYSWNYIQFETRQLGRDSLKLIIKDQSADIYMGLGMDGLQYHEFPNLHYDVYMIPKNTSSQVFYLQAHLMAFKAFYPDYTILNIGFFNPNNFPIIFYFELFTRDQTTQTDSYFTDNVINSLFVIMILIILYLGIKLYNRRQQQQLLIIQQQFFRRRRRVGRIALKNKKTGFNTEFIYTHFPQFYYLDLIQRYPPLSEIVECIVCLETMTPQAQVSERDHINTCSLTPCFHLFHSHCLQKWLQNEKCCPLCRKEFNEETIRAKPWVDINEDVSIRESSRMNPYITRMKTRSEATQQSDIPLRVDEMQSSENIQIVGSIPPKSARDLIIK